MHDSSLFAITLVLHRLVYNMKRLDAGPTRGPGDFECLVARCSWRKGGVRADAARKHLQRVHRLAMKTTRETQVRINDGLKRNRRRPGDDFGMATSNTSRLSRVWEEKAACLIYRMPPSCLISSTSLLAYYVMPGAEAPSLRAARQDKAQG